MRSNTYIFGGPVVPPYLEAVCVRCDILASSEYDLLRARLDCNLAQLTDGLRALGLMVNGGATPIIFVLVGDEEDTLNAGQFLFEKGYYVQSVTVPAVPYRAGVLRIQVNANHRVASIAGLVNAMKALQRVVRLPKVEAAAQSLAA
jgi:7-keto-8-aminopelargonate synthetase-like enzyme